MQIISQFADVQVWVCVNERAPQANLLPSCQSIPGQKIYELLASQLGRLGTKYGKTIWVNRTLCQGFCSAQGVTVTCESLKIRWQGVGESDCAQIVAAIQEKLS